MTLDERKNKQYSTKSANAPFDKKDIDLKARTVRGVANTYKFVDSVGDILMPKCCAKSIKERGPASKAIAKIKFARNHDLNCIAGKLTLLEETEDALIFEAAMGRSDLGRNTLNDYQDEMIDNHSIGYQEVYEKTKVVKVNTPEWDDMLTWIKNPQDLAGFSQVYLVKEIKLYEISAVAFGANSDTPFLGMAKNLTTESVISKLQNRIDALGSGIEKSIGEIINCKVDADSDIEEIKADLYDTVKSQLAQLNQFVEDMELVIEVKDQRKEHIEKEQVKSGHGNIESAMGIDYGYLTAELKK